MLKVRKTAMADLETIADIFANARERMKAGGNPKQWRDDRPDMRLVIRDIEQGNSYVVTDGERIVGTFAYPIGIEPTYLQIDGAWLNDEPYGTIHRIASDGSTPGVFEAALAFAESFGLDIRIDTHRDNRIMLHKLDRHGFVKCGTIIVDDGTKRFAFQKLHQKPKVLVIVGPTAVGKTDFGIECAQRFDGEIISGDSIQIYRGLNIGSAKPSAEELAQARHYLIDIRDADGNYSVRDFQELARCHINEISDRGRLPIIVGGTGLYIKAALYDYEFFEEEEADQEYEDLSNQELYALLQEKDPEALEKIHINNRRRLVRALNIYEKHAKGISQIKKQQKHEPLYDCKIIGLTLDKEELYARISERVDRMMAAGLLQEIEGLLASGLSFDDQSMQGIGYKEFRPYFAHEKSLEECVEQVKINSRHFAKRQYTFFRNQLEVKWFTDRHEAIAEIEKWLEE